MTFQRSLKPSSSNTGGLYVDFSASSVQPIILAYSSSTPSSSSVSANLQQHSLKSIYGSSDLLASSSAFSGVSAPTVATNGDNSGGIDWSSPKVIVAIHGVLMLLAWAVFAPIGIFIAAFLKSSLGVWWFRLHFV